MLSITQDECDTIYDVLDNLPSSDYLPLKHEINKLLKSNENPETIAAFLIHCSEYNVNETSGLKKLLNKEINVTD